MISLSLLRVVSNLSIVMYFQLKFTGRYECTLRGSLINFQQSVLLPSNAIQRAPNVRLKNEINVKCEDGQKEELKCCVQSSYRVTWYQGTNVLPARES